MEEKNCRAACEQNKDQILTYKKYKITFNILYGREELQGCLRNTLEI